MGFICLLHAGGAAARIADGDPIVSDNTKSLPALQGLQSGRHVLVPWRSGDRIAVLDVRQLVQRHASADERTIRLW